MKSQVVHTVHVMFLVRLQGKFEIDNSWEWKVKEVRRRSDKTLRCQLMFDQGWWNAVMKTQMKASIALINF